MRNLDSGSITREVASRMAPSTDPRLRALLTSLVGHLHDFARDVKLTEAEWMAAIQFLTRTGLTCTATRQEFILLSDTLGLSQLVVSINNARPPDATEQTVFGPFHVADAPLRPSGYDISEGGAGNALDVAVRVVSLAGDPLTNACVEVWHADGNGGYDTQNPHWTLAEARFRGRLLTDVAGMARFRTTMPSSYPIPMDGPVGDMMRATGRSPMRPAHLHFRVAHDGFEPLVTHVFDASDPYLDDDAVFGVLDSTVAIFDPVEDEGADRRHFRLETTLVLAPRMED
jgi:hydroxyquinol 1,2-dioxygenase